MNQSGNYLSRAFSSFVVGMNGVGTVLIFALVVMINLDVISRFVFNAPIAGVTELVELSIVAIVFLQLADAVRAGRLTRSDGFYLRLQETRPRFAHVLGALFDLAGALFFVTIIMGATPMLVDAWERNNRSRPYSKRASFPACCLRSLLFLRLSAWRHSLRTTLVAPEAKHGRIRHAYICREETCFPKRVPWSY